MQLMGRIVVKSTAVGEAHLDGGLTSVEPLEDTGLFVADTSDPRAVIESSAGIVWAAPIVGDGAEESYPTGEVSIRFRFVPEPKDLESFAREHAVEVRRHNEFVPEQVVVAPIEAHSTWLPDLVEDLKGQGMVANAWPNTLSRYRVG